MVDAMPLSLKWEKTSMNTENHAMNILGPIFYRLLKNIEE